MLRLKESEGTDRQNTGPMLSDIFPAHRTTITVSVPAATRGPGFPYLPGKSVARDDIRSRALARMVNRSLSEARFQPTISAIARPQPRHTSASSRQQLRTQGDPVGDAEKGVSGVMSGGHSLRW